MYGAGMSSCNALGIRLKEERKRLGYSQQSFSDKLDVSRRTQTMYETGSRDPGGCYLRKALSEGVDIAYVMTGVRSFRQLVNIGQSEEKLLQLFMHLTPEQKDTVFRIIYNIAQE
ncbi:helix-turn-helix domain-containing protein [Pseudomonas sp. NPDC089407]|uniref:helix-turn-helix domain-containing protein n=1 Tax=Pseudomonas sp. NPDC089407 TaxID=3364464 RepID=UPI00384E5D22